MTVLRQSDMAWTPADEPAFFREVVRVVNEFDLMGLNPGSHDGTPVDEYASEARAIESILVNRGHIEFRDLSAIWLKWFSDDLSAHAQSLRPFLAALNDLVPQNPT